MQRTLRDMVVVITGASAGIGKALAEQLAPQGAKLVLAARRLDRIEALNRALGGNHLCLATDVSQQEDCHNLIDRSIAAFGRIDTLVCNAGYGIHGKVADTTPDQTRAIFATNLLGTTDCIYYALPAMQKQPLRDGYRGQIMIVSSFAGRRGIPFIGMYSATKAAQLVLAEALRVEVQPYNIAVTSVHPIQTRTEFGDALLSVSNLELPKTRMAQTMEHVARRMARAIVKPRPESWPSELARWLAGGATLVPSVADLVIGQYRKKVEKLNQKAFNGYI